MKSYLILFLVILITISPTEILRRRGHSIPFPDLNNNLIQQNRNENLIDPLSIHIALGQTQQHRTGILI